METPLHWRTLIAVCLSPRFLQGSRRLEEWIDDLNLSKPLSVLKILRDQVTTVGYLCCRDDQSIPPGKAITVLDQPTPFNDTGIDRHRMPCQERMDIASGMADIKPWFKFFRDRHVELLKDLKTQPSCSGAPAMFPPGHRLFLFLRLRGVPSV